MSTYELRDLDEARHYLLQGLWWQRVVPPAATTVRQALEWAKEIVANGEPLPPIGFVADLGHVALGMDWETRSNRPAMAVPGLPINLVRTYEDHVLGKVYADWTFSRASDALRRYDKGRDQARGLAFFLKQFRERSGFSGVEFSPGVVTTALETAPDEVLAQGWESLRQDGVQPLLTSLYESLITASRRTAEVLAPEDVFELERGTALHEEGQRLALRQVLHVANAFEAALPRQRVRPLARRMEVPTRILDEDTYPVGGFTSISNRGSIESLLHSQLAYMEPKADEPDLFDIKFLRDELLFYSRDENQFLRRRRTFVFVLHPDLVTSRFKDAELPYQRGVLLLALLVVVVRKLSEWLSTDALVFRFLFLPDDDAQPLAAERQLLQTILAEQITNSTVEIQEVESLEKAAKLCTQWSRRSMCHCLNVAVRPPELDPEDTVVTHLQIDGARPALGDPGSEPAVVLTDEALESWNLALEQVLQRWI
jgi:hypothetical protein